ncbi:KH domain-containing protein [Leptolyngbya sp. AN02str]|uniref:KH domain-containing protein n=1 Tax=Leptolyngbya sp. AN02str TaxID=3423363 RepID=UPI003D32304F
MSDSAATEIQPLTNNLPDFEKLVRYLVTPFLESPDSLKIDCEVLPRSSRVILRIAFEGEDKGRVFGRGGRNIQAVRTVLQAIAQLHQCSVHLDVYGAPSGGRDADQGGGHRSERRSEPRRSPPRPNPSRR